MQRRVLNHSLCVVPLRLFTLRSSFSWNLHTCGKMSCPLIPTYPSQPS